MCYFITIAVETKHTGEVADAFGKGFHILPTANPSVLAVIPPGYTPLLLTNGHCSCGLYVRPRIAKDNAMLDRLRKKYAKLGWSESKISRALSQARESRPDAGGFSNEVLDGLETLLQTCDSVAVVVHEYSGDVERQQLSLTRLPPCDYDELRTHAAVLEEDQLMTVSGSRRV